MAMVALRGPVAGRWQSFHLRPLLFGAEAEVIHYNLFSRTMDVLVNRVQGIPLLSYFDDLGAPVPS